MNKFLNLYFIRLVLLFLILYGIFKISSCKTTNKEIETLSFNLNQPDPSLNVKINSIIRLETLDNALIGEVTKIIFYDDKFYILDRMIGKSLFVFDKNGNFLSKAKRGRGPGECLDPWDFIIDPVNQTISLWDQASYQMIKYDLLLNYVDADHYEGISIVNAEYMNDDSLLVFAQVQETANKNSNNAYSNYTIYTNNMTKGNTMIATDRTLVNLTLDSPICKTNRTIFVAPFDNNIYSFTNHKPIILYTLDFGKLNITQEDIRKGISHVFNSARHRRKITSIDNLHENEKYLSFSFFYHNKLNFFIHSKETNKNYYSENIFQKRILPRCLIKGIVNDGDFLAISDPKDVKNFVSSELEPKIGEVDNPIIVIFSIQEMGYEKRKYEKENQ